MCHSWVKINIEHLAQPWRLAIDSEPLFKWKVNTHNLYITNNSSSLRKPMQRSHLERRRSTSKSSHLLIPYGVLENLILCHIYVGTTFCQHQEDDVHRKNVNIRCECKKKTREQCGFQSELSDHYATWYGWMCVETEWFTWNWFSGLETIVKPPVAHVTAYETAIPVYQKYDIFSKMWTLNLVIINKEDVFEKRFTFCSISNLRLVLSELR